MKGDVKLSKPIEVEDPEEKYGFRVVLDTEFNGEEDEFEHYYAVEKVEIEKSVIKQVVDKSHHETLEGVVQTLLSFTNLEVR